MEHNLYDNDTDDYYDYDRFISGMAGLSYTERLTILKLYSLQHRREIYYYLCVEDFGGSGP